MGGEARRAAVIGQGYVGLPVAVRAVLAGYDVVGFEVDDFWRTRALMLAAGTEFIGPVQETETRVWNHFRGPDGNIYEIMAIKV